MTLLRIMYHFSYESMVDPCTFRYVNTVRKGGNFLLRCCIVIHYLLMCSNDT